MVDRLGEPWRVFNPPRLFWHQVTFPLGHSQNWKMLRVLIQSLVVLWDEHGRKVTTTKTVFFCSDFKNLCHCWSPSTPIVQASHRTLMEATVFGNIFLLKFDLLIIQWICRSLNCFRSWKNCPIRRPIVIRLTLFPGRFQTLHSEQSVPMLLNRKPKAVFGSCT
jgi:hypothetical protein